MNICPIICDDNYIACKGGIDDNGCNMIDSCVYTGTIMISTNKMHCEKPPQGSHWFSVEITRGKIKF